MKVWNVLPQALRKYSRQGQQMGGPLYLLPVPLPTSPVRLIHIFELLSELSQAGGCTKERKQGDAHAPAAGQ